jgi:hypothetical protein
MSYFDIGKIIGGMAMVLMIIALFTTYGRKLIGIVFNDTVLGSWADKSDPIKSFGDAVMVSFAVIVYVLAAMAISLLTTLLWFPACIIIFIAIVVFINKVK